MGIFDNIDPTTAALMSATAASSQGATRLPQYFMNNVANAIGAIPKGANEGQQMQMGQLNLERMKAIQPYFLNQMKNSMGGAPFGVPSSSAAPGAAGTPGGSTSPADALFSQALMSAYMSGDMGKAATVLQSWAEHNPELAGKIKAAQESNTLIKTPQGTYTTQSVGGGTSGGTGGAISTLPGTMSPEAQKSALVDLYGDDGKPVNESNVPMAADGKPLLPKQSNLFSPDPSGTPKYNTPNTETGVNQTKLFQEGDVKADAALTGQQASLQQEQFRLKELADVYKQVQAGTLTAQNPALVAKLVAWGVIKNPAEIKDLAGVQNALQSHVLQIIQQIKDTNANMGGAPARTFGSEISALQEEGENPGASPEALWNIIGQARGVVDHHLDLAKGWNSIGGLGNRMANGYTMRPDTYAQNFMNAHDISDYKTSAQKAMGPFKGMGPSIPSDAIAHLKSHPTLAPKFQKKYGVDPAQYLGAPNGQ